MSAIITISAFQYELAGGLLDTDSVELRIFYTGGPGENFLDADGNVVPYGSTTNLYLPVDCTVSSGEVSIDSFNLSATDNSSNISSVATAQFYVNGAPSTFLFSDWIITATLGASISYGSLYTYNLTAQLAYILDPLYLTAPQVAALIASTAGAFLNASATVKGIAKLSVNPASATNPVAVGNNDPKVLSRVYNAAAPIYGIVGDGITNDTAAWTAYLAAVPNGAIAFVPAGMNIRLNSSVTLTGRKSITITSWLDARNDSDFAPRFTWGGVGGVMFDLDICQCVVIRGFKFALATGKSVDKFVNIDGTAGTQISTANTVRYNTFDSAGQSNVNAKLVCISEVATSNNENMNVSNNSFFVSTGTRATAAGVAIYNGANPNAKHQRFNDNTISNAAIGIRCVSGSFGVNHQGGGQNGVDIQIDHNTEGIPIINLEAEDSRQGLVVASSGDAPVHCDSCRFSNGSQTNAGGFLEIDSRVLITNSKFDFDPPVGGILIEDVGTGNLRLIMEDCEFPGVTATQVGITQWTVGLGSVYSIRPTVGITGIEQNSISSFRQRYNQTVGAGILDPFLLEQVWPTGTADVQNAFRVNVTDVGTSVAGSALMRLQTASADKFIVGKSGLITTAGLLIQPEGTALTVSANTITPTSPIHQCGAGLIKTITVPTGFTSGTIALIPTAAFTYDATGNILGTGTAAIGRTMFATFSSSTSKWSMSY